MVRLTRTGGEANAVAIRIARSYLGKDNVAVCGYHGWQDWYIGSTTKNLGVISVTTALIISPSFTFLFLNSASKRA